MSLQLLLQFCWIQFDDTIDHKKILDSIDDRIKQYWIQFDERIKQYWIQFDDRIDHKTIVMGYCEKVHLEDNCVNIAVLKISE